MIRVDCIQGDPVWRANRLGIPTASQTDKILTPKTMKPSASQRGLLRTCCAEWLLGCPLESGSTAYMDRGRDMEDEAVRWYEFDRNFTVERVGFILRDDKMFGGSPDGLIGSDGGVEIKCLSAVEHVGAMLEEIDLTEYRCQVQSYLWLCDRQWWDRVYYHPEWPTMVIRMERDDEFISTLAEHVDGFIEKLLDARKRLLAMGLTPKEPVIQTVSDLEQARRERDEREAASLGEQGMAAWEAVLG